MSWLVVGPHAVLDVEPGGVITAEIPAVQAAMLANAGHIAEVVEDQPQATVEQEAPAPAVADNPQEGD